MEKEIKEYIDKKFEECIDMINSNTQVVRKDVEKVLTNHKACVMDITNKALIESRSVMGTAINSAYKDLRQERDITMRFLKEKTTQIIKEVVEEKFNGISVSLKEIQDSQASNYEKMSDHIDEVERKSILGNIQYNLKTKPTRTIITIGLVSVVLVLVILKIFHIDTIEPIVEYIIGKLKIG